MADQLITGTTLIEDRRSERGEVWSCAGVNFMSQRDDQVDRDGSDSAYGNVQCGTTGGTFFTAQVNIPNGSKIIGVVVYGSESDESYTLHRITMSDSAISTMATANMNTEDTTITSDVVDNSNYAYMIRTSTLDPDDKIYRARIRYEF